MRALDADAAIADVLRAEPDNLTAPRCGLKRELQYEPLLRSKRPIGAIPRNLVVGPVMSPLLFGSLI